MRLGYLKSVTFLLVLSLFGAAFGQGGAKTLRIAAAADLQPVMPAFASAYEKETGTRLEVSFGSSSALATQIRNGAPFDVFLGADYSFPEQVIAAGLAVEKLPVPYAQGTLVLWSRKDSPLGAPKVELLTDPRVKRIAVADQFHAPYGRAAAAYLRNAKLEAQVKPKLVTAENIAQTAQFVESGNAQIGFVSLTFAQSGHGKEVGNFVRVDAALYPKITQCGVVIKTSKEPEAAKRFMDWMLGEKVQSHLADFGLRNVR